MLFSQALREGDDDGTTPVLISAQEGYLRTLKWLVAQLVRCLLLPVLPVLPVLPCPPVLLVAEPPCARRGLRLSKCLTTTGRPRPATAAGTATRTFWSSKCCTSCCPSASCSGLSPRSPHLPPADAASLPPFSVGVTLGKIYIPQRLYMRLCMDGIEGVRSETESGY